VVRGRGAAAADDAGSLPRLLRACSASQDWAPLVARLRALPPVALDSELRSMEVLEGAPDSALADLALLLRFLEEQAAANANFELVQVGLAAVAMGTLPACMSARHSQCAYEQAVRARLPMIVLLRCAHLHFPPHAVSSALPRLQAVLRVALRVHGDTIVQHDKLRQVAERMQQQLVATWRRLDGLLQSCRCIVGFLGNTQA
jgi:hypothetical protein